MASKSKTQALAGSKRTRSSSTRANSETSAPRDGNRTDAEKPPKRKMAKPRSMVGEGEDFDGSPASQHAGRIPPALEASPHSETHHYLQQQNILELLRTTLSCRNEVRAHSKRVKNAETQLQAERDALDEQRNLLEKLHANQNLTERGLMAEETTIEPWIVYHTECLDIWRESLENAKSKSDAAVIEKSGLEDELYSRLGDAPELAFSQLDLPDEFYQFLGVDMQCRTRFPSLEKRLQSTKHREEDLSVRVQNLEEEISQAESDGLQAVKTTYSMLQRFRGMQTAAKLEASRTAEYLDLLLEVWAENDKSLNRLATIELEDESPEADASVPQHSIDDTPDSAKDSASEISTVLSDPAVDDEGFLDEQMIQHRENLRETRSSARHQLNEAEGRLDGLRDSYEGALRDFKAGNFRGLRKQSDFDRAHLQSMMTITRKIQEAEEKYEQARLKAQEFGVPPSAHEESVFASQEDDGYPLSMESNTIEAVDTARMNAW